MKDSVFSGKLALWATITAASAAVLFLCSSLRHYLFHSSAFDLAIFDQGVYLLSVDRAPIISFLGHHLLGDHAAFIFYPIALLYKIYPSVYWLLAIQAIALATGGFLTVKLAQQAGLTQPQATSIGWVYLLYPVVFNANLFDFHPEVLALPGILGAVWAARAEQLLLFCACLVATLSAKAALSLTVAAMGIGLLVFENKRRAGAMALVLGLIWFAIATQIIIPAFSGEQAAAIRRYNALGNSVSEIILNLFLKPDIVLTRLLTGANLVYLVLLFLPVIGAISRRHLAPLLGIVPTLVLNLTSDSLAQKNLVHHYSLPVLPFLVLAVISTLAAGDRGFLRQRWIVLWAVASFFALAKFGFFWTVYLENLDTWQATREAIAQIETSGGVLTSAQIAPHLSHRPNIQLALNEKRELDLKPFDYALLNLKNPGWNSSPETVQFLRDRLNQNTDFQLQYDRDGVMLWVRKVRQQS